MIKNKQLQKDILVYVLVFFVLTIPFFLTDLDIILQRFFYKPGEGFYLKTILFWDVIYKYGIFPGYLLTVAALFALTWSYWKPKLIHIRKWAVMLIFVNVLGPGILVNATFKDHWGRPRPREIVEFGGKEEFVNPWVKGDGKGKSFPCGHASMGFFISVPFLFLRKKYKRIAWAFMVTGIVYGSLIGVARMIAGGHFASDVVWSAGMVWFAALLAYYALNVQKEIVYRPLDGDKQKKKARRMTILMGIVLPALITTALLATPYISKKTKSWEYEELQESGMSHMLVNLKVGNVDVNYGEGQHINYEVTGFGFPNSKIRSKIEYGDTTKYRFERMGWFTEVRNNIHIKFPAKASWSNQINMDDGNIFVRVPGNSVSSDLYLHIEKGDLTLIVDEKSNFSLDHNAKKIENSSDYQPVVNAADSVFRIHAELTQGKIRIERR